MHIFRSSKIIYKIQWPNFLNMLKYYIFWDRVSYSPDWTGRRFAYFCILSARMKIICHDIQLNTFIFKLLLPTEYRWWSCTAFIYLKKKKLLKMSMALCICNWRTWEAKSRLNVPSQPMLSSHFEVSLYNFVKPCLKKQCSWGWFPAHCSRWWWPWVLGLPAHPPWMPAFSNHIWNTHILPGLSDLNAFGPKK